MTTSSAAIRPSSEGSGQKVTSEGSNQKVTVEILEDILYEILATGLEPTEAELTTQDIETFLHGHARSAKSYDDFIKFFEDHKLSTDPNVHLKSSALGHLPTKIAMPISAVSDTAVPRRLEPSTSEPIELLTDETLELLPVIEADEPEESSEVRTRRPQPQPSDNPLMSWLAILLIAALFGLTIGLGYFLFDRLRQEIDETKALQKESLRVIDLLRNQVTELRAGAVLDREALQQLDAKSELLVETLVPFEQEQQQ
ncbi:MAG: hypothetical protein JXA30_19460 [Deltaproteobacteria bacterium]|nr:hypothetical protein [Deltaproteobacteria bacterium]